ncbi:MAG: TolC family protein [Chitinispirillaceae bacterium]|nr:TolC family protein [Chitinispirillaceae bacterium]
MSLTVKRVRYIPTLTVICLLLTTIQSLHGEALPLSEEQAVKLAEVNNLTLKALNHKLKAADMGVKSAVTGFLPQASLSSMYTRKSGNDMFSKFLGSDLKNSYSLGIDIQQPLFNGFATLNSLRSAQTTGTLQKVTNDKNAQTIRFAVRRIYWSIVNLQKSESVANEAIRQLEELTASQKAMFDQGMTTEHDYLLTGASLEQARMNLIQVSGTIETMKRQFAELLGLPVTTELILIDTTARPVVPPCDNDSIVAWALENRPDLRESQLQLRLSDLGVKMTRSSLFPAVNAGYSWSASRPDQTLQDQWGDDWSAYISLNFTLFEWGDRFFKIRKAREEYRSLSLLHEQKKSVVEREVRDAFQEIELSVKKLDASLLLAEARGKSYEASRAKYDEGVLPMYELLDAHSALVSANYQTVQATTDLKLAVINLSMAGLGGSSGSSATGGVQ